jgi:hypothetical protein
MPRKAAAAAAAAAAAGAAEEAGTSGKGSSGVVYKKVRNANPGVRVVGACATPQRTPQRRRRGARLRRRRQPAAGAVLDSCLARREG